jgi:hypothetical protein
MAKYGDIIAGLTVGNYGSAGPVGFTNRWDGPGSSQNLDVIEDLSSPSGKALRARLTASSRTFWSWDGINADPDRGTSTSIALIRIKNAPSGSSASFGGLVARGDGDGASETCITGVFARNGSGATVRAIRYLNAAATVTDSSTGAWLQNGIYWLKTVVSGTSSTSTLYAENELNGTEIKSVTASAPASNANNWHGLFAFASDADFDVLYYAIGTGSDLPDPPAGPVEPVLTSATGTKTGDTTASGSVSTDTASGTLYAVVTTSATPPSSADIKTGAGAVYATNKTVTATGAQAFHATGLTASTTYYWHFIHNDSNIITSNSFTTDATPAVPPSTAPTGLAAVAQSDTVIRLTWGSLTGATGYKIRRDDVTVTDVGNVLTVDVSGLTAETPYGFEVLAYNTAGDGPWSAVASETTQSTPDDIILIADVDGANVSATLSSIVNPSSATPRFNLEMRPTAINGTNLSGWRHSSFAIGNAEGKSPVFALNRNTMTLKGATPALTWLPMYTLDPFVLEPVFVQATSRSLIGGSTGTIEWSFPDPLPAGTIYVMTHAMGAQGQAPLLAQHLLNDYSSIAAPTSSADVNGVYLTSPAEVDENGRQIGGHDCYAIKLTFPGPTTDGGPKRKLVQTAGQHVAGEASSWVAFYSGLKYLLDSPNADAVRNRANFDVYLYFNICPNGLFGGHGRHNFRSSVDMNRDWINQSLIETETVAAAILADTGGSADVCFDWHCYRDADDDDKFIMLTPDTPNARRFGELGEPIFGMPYKPDEWSDIVGSFNNWAYSSLGVAFTSACECPQRGDTSSANYEQIGVNWTKTLAAADADGMFYAPENITTISSTIAVPMSAMTLARDLPSNSVSILSNIGVPTSAVLLESEVPEYIADITSSVLVPTSSVVLSLAPTSGLSVFSTVPAPSSTVSMERLLPEYEATISSTISAPTSSLVLGVEDGSVSITISSNISAPTSVVSLDDEVPEYTLTMYSSVSVPTSFVYLINGDIIKHISPENIIILPLIKNILTLRR